MQWLLQTSLMSAALLSAIANASVLTAERLLTAPRPGSGVPNPSGNRALVGVKTFSFKEDRYDNVLYKVKIPSSDSISDATTPSYNVEVISRNTSSGFWLTDDFAAYIDSKSSTLYAKDLSTSYMHDDTQDWIKVGAFPAPVDTAQVARKSDGKVSLVFSAQVYGDGDLNAVKKHDESEAVKEWDRVKGEWNGFVCNKVDADVFRPSSL